MTMTLIETKTLGAAAATIEFTSIPQDFDDLLLVVSGRSTATQNEDALCLQFNNTTANHSSRRLAGDGSTAFSDTISATAGGSNAFFAAGLPGNATANTFGNASIYLPNYKSSVAKSMSADSTMENNATATDLSIHAGLWNNSAAITSIKLLAFRASANFVSGSTVSLYGITKGSDGIVTTS